MEREIVESISTETVRRTLVKPPFCCFAMRTRLTAQ